MAERLPEATRDLLAVRDNFQCRRCHGPLRELHHRRGRGMGGTKINPHGYARLVWLCGPCHIWAERERAQAYETGWAIRRSDPRPESEIPVIDNGGHVWLLDDYGNATRQGGTGG